MRDVNDETEFRLWTKNHRRSASQLVCTLVSSADLNMTFQFVFSNLACESVMDQSHAPFGHHHCLHCQSNAFITGPSVLLLLPT